MNVAQMGGMPMGGPMGAAYFNIILTMFVDQRRRRKDHHTLNL
jgi:hypothetical protein